LTAEQWKQLKAMRAALPEATITPKLHQGTLDCADVPWGVVTRYDAIAVVQFGPFERRRCLWPASLPKLASVVRTLETCAWTTVGAHRALAGAHVS
jgi:hypothetical protein